MLARIIVGIAINNSGTSQQITIHSQKCCKMFIYGQIVEIETSTES